MKALACVAILASLIATANAADTLVHPTGDAIVSPDATLQLLYTREAKINGGLTEGPAAAPDGSIYFSDIPFGADKGLILRFDPRSRKTEIFAEDSGKSNGLIFDANGDLLACEGSDSGGRRVSKWNVKTKERTTVTDNYNGKRYNACNDLCIDRQGRIFFSDPRYLGTETRELEHRAVYRIDRGGKVSEVTHEVSKPNGVGISPDDRTLYVVDHDNGTDRIDPTKPAPEHGPMALYAFPLDSKGAVSGKRVTLIDFGKEAGCDGITVDEKGNIYLSCRSLKRPGVMVMNSTGKEIAFIPTGPKNQKSEQGKDNVGIPSNVEFGSGNELNVLYITVDKSLYRIPLKVNGRHAYDQ